MGAGGNRVTGTLSKATVPPSRRRLIELMQQVNFGRIDGLIIRDGDPLFDRPPRVIREIKLCGENGPRPELDADDFLLKAQVIELFGHFDRMGDGTIGSLEVKYGLPFRLTVEESAV
jgi:hypothetical protein